MQGGTTLTPEELLTPEYAALLKAAQFHGLPKALWLKIYEFILFDIDLRDRANFNLVCKYFDALTKDPDLLRVLIQRFFPIFMDSQMYLTNPACFLEAIRLLLGFKFPPIDEPAEFIPVYVSSKMFVGLRYEEVKLRLRNQLRSKYRELSKAKELIQEMDVAFSQVDRDVEDFKYLMKLGGRDFSDPRWMEDLEFGKVLKHAALCRNFRTLVALFAPSHLTPQGMRGLQWAAAINDLELLRKLMAEKRKLYLFNLVHRHPVHPEEDFRNNETLKAIDTHLVNDNILEIRKCLHVEFDVHDVRRLLSHDEFCEAVSTWHYDDIFQTMTADTFRALQVLAGGGKFQAALVRPLERNNRTDLMQLMNLADIPDTSKDTRGILCVYFARYSSAESIQDFFNKQIFNIPDSYVEQFINALQERKLAQVVMRNALDRGRFSYDDLIERFGANHPFTKIAPQPDLAPVASAPSYLPSFNEAQPQPARGTKRNGEDSADPSKRARPG